METLLLTDAAKLVGLHPVTLAERARAGKIPGAAKPGKQWVFPLEGLRAYLQALSPCPYIAGVESGGSNYPRNAEELGALLGLPKRNRRRSTTNESRVRYGGRKG